MPIRLRLVANGTAVPEGDDTDIAPQSIKRVFIRGVTPDGRKFRPSNWTERLYYAVASYGPNRTITFSPHVIMQVGSDGVNCVVVDIKLQEENPMLFDFLIGFARDNKMVMQDQDRNPITAI